MAQNNRSELAIHVVDYPHTTPGWALPTAGLPSPHPRVHGSRNQLYALLQQPTVVNGRLALEPLPYSHMSCFRDAMLTILFALKPFMNFLDSVPLPQQAPQHNAVLPSNMVMSLARLGQAFWTPSRPNSTRFGTMNTEMNAFWSDWMTLGYQQVDSSGWLLEEDIMQFLSFVFMELNTPGAHIPQHDINMLSQLFEVDLNRRFVNSCGCVQKQRQGFVEDGRFWYVNAQWDNSEHDFSTAVSMSMYQYNADRPFTCPFCGTVARGAYEYSKLRTVPEILLVCALPSQNGFLDTTVRFQIPEVLDLTRLQDKPFGGQRAPPNSFDNEDDEDPRALLYQLQSIATYRAAYPNLGAHYRAHIRRDNGLWDCLDNAPSRVYQSTLSNVETDQYFQPRVLAYVRREQPEIIATALDQATTSVPDTSNGNAIRQGASQAQQLPGSSQGTGISSNAQNTQDTQNQSVTVNGQNATPVSPPPANSDASIDTSTWAVSDFQRELKIRGLGIGGKKNVDNYRSIWQAYSNNPRDYTLYTIPGLRTLMTNRAMGIPKTTRLKNDFIAALRAHDSNTASNQPANNPMVPTKSPQQPQQPHQADDALTIENTRLRAENQALHVQLDTLQQAHDQTTASLTASQQARAQATTSLNMLQQTHNQTTAGFSALQRLHTTFVANNDRLTAENQALRTQQGATGPESPSSQVPNTLAADNVRLTAECQTLRANSVRIDNNIKSTTSRPIMLLAFVTVRSRTDRFLIPLPLYHFTTWTRPTSDTLVEDSGSVKVTVHLARQHIDPVTSRVRDRDVVLRVDGQGVGNNGGDVTVELRLMTIQGPLGLNQFRTHAQRTSSDTESSNRNNTFRPLSPSDFAFGRSASNDQPETRHDQPVGNESSQFAHDRSESSIDLYAQKQYQGDSRGPSSAPCLPEPSRKRSQEQAEQEQLLRSTRRKTNGLEHDNSSTRTDNQQRSSPALGPTSTSDPTPVRPSPVSLGRTQSCEDPLEAEEHRHDNPSPDNHNDSGRQTDDPHDMAGDPLFASFLE